MRIQCISRPLATCSLPTIGMLFSAWQATTHAVQPMQDQVDRHAPLVERVAEETLGLAVLAGIPGGGAFRLIEIDVGRSVGIVALLLDVGELGVEVAFFIVRFDGGNLAGERAAIHRAVLLGESHRVALAGEFHRGTGGEIRGGGSAQRIGVETAVDADESDVGLIRGLALEFIFLVEGLAISERNDDGIFRLAEGNEDRNFKRLAVHGDLDDGRLAVFAFAIGTDIGVFALHSEHGSDGFDFDDLVVDADILGGFRRDESGVVPGEFGNRIGHFLEPGVIDPAAVID